MVVEVYLDDIRIWLFSPDHLQQLHHRHGVEEMKTDKSDDREILDILKVDLVPWSQWWMPMISLWGAIIPFRPLCSFGNVADGKTGQKRVRFVKGKVVQNLPGGLISQIHLEVFYLKIHLEVFYPNLSGGFLSKIHLEVFYPKFIWRFSI